MFKGRAGRSEYWWWVLFSFVVQFFFSFLLQLIDFNDSAAGLENYGTAIVVTGYLVSLVLLVPTLSVTCRRLHDIGKSGWWQLYMGLAIALGWVLFFVGLGGLVIAEIFSDGNLLSILFWCVLLFSLLFAVGVTIRWITWLARESDHTSNKYG